MPGLVNLQPHLGFNQSAFLLTSAIDTLVPDHRGIFFVGGLLPWLGLVALIFGDRADGAWGQFGKKPAARPIEIAYAISLPAWIIVLVSGNSSSASPDSISFCLILHLFLVFSCFIASADQFGALAELGRDSLPRSNLPLRQSEQPRICRRRRDRLRCKSLAWQTRDSVASGIEEYLS